VYGEPEDVSGKAGGRVSVVSALPVVSPTSCEGAAERKCRHNADAIIIS